MKYQSSSSSKSIVKRSAALAARRQLRERMGMIVTIDRADTPRSISKQQG